MADIKYIKIGSNTYNIKDSSAAEVITKVTISGTGNVSTSLDSGKFYVFSNNLDSLSITALNAPTSGIGI